MNKVTYTIKITKTEHDVTFTDKLWKQVVNEPDEKHDELYRYVETEVTRDVETKLFEQTVDELNLPQVVMTINAVRTTEHNTSKE